MRLWPIIVLLALVTRLPALGDRIYSNDEATYSALAARMVAGGAMYSDAVDHKPPGIATLYAGVFAAAGVYRLAPVRVALILVVALTGIAIAELAARCTGDPRARIAGVLYVVASATGFPDNVQAANTELFLNLPLSVAAIALLSAVASIDVGTALGLAVAAGALTGVAALFKYQSALAGLAWLWAAWTVRRRPRAAAAIAFGLAVGFAAVAGLVLWHYASTGRLDAFLFWGWRYNFSYIASMPLPRQAARALIRTAAIGAMWSPLVWLASRRAGRDGPGGVARRVPAESRAIAIVWLMVMMLAVAAGGRYFGNYYLMLLPPLAVLAAWTPVPRAARLAAGALVVASVAAAALWFAIRPDLREYDLRCRAVGTWVRDHSAPSDRLFVWGDSTQVYMYANRVMGTRFAFANYHTGKIWGMGADEADAASRPDLVVPRAWDELLQDFERAPPAFIVDAAAGGLHGFGGRALDRYPALWRIVESEYQLTATVDGVPVYRHVTDRR